MTENPENIIKPKIDNNKDEKNCIFNFIANRY